MNKSSLSLALTALALSVISSTAARAEPMTLWPNIPFVRGQDSCQHIDAYGLGKREQMGTMITQIERLVMAGADIDSAVQALKSIDTLVEKDRRAARNASGIDVTLESAFKASLDELYRRTNPGTRMVGFANSAPMTAAMLAARSAGKSPAITNLGEIGGFAWGTYSFAPGCSANLYVTLHIQESCGNISSFQGVGRAERVMGDLAAAVFRAYQATRFPTDLELDGQTVRLTSPAGTYIAKASTPEQAELACRDIGARLPTAREYDLLEIRGDWNGGICTQGRHWALAGGKVLAPELTRPSPVRNQNEVTSDQYFFYCVGTSTNTLLKKADRE